ncbi:sensor histidine kinase [Zunongwangia endophytica]|uniref:Sensor histidine kinase n=1 Tax=Zunongwangia endophytica TaxID=1808945 RepID=A0ABV8H917_9FLAO|nr:histidine kinase [Zunongwangia endophytica]MDN3593553.1 histidine kinase [Zunongwangia endophytica]
MKLKLFLALLKTVVLHGLFWLAVLFFYTFFFAIKDSDLWISAQFSLALMPVTIGTTYTFSYVLLPNYLVRRKYFLFSLYSFYALVISASLIIFSAFYGYLLSLGLEWEGNYPVSKGLTFIFFAVYLVIVLGCGFSLVKDYFKTLNRNEELKNTLLESELQLKIQELQYLKMQIHPHFLFNTLNTIYGLTLTKKDSAPGMILKLADLLDYILYETMKNKVPLQREIQHLKDYIELEKLRFGERLTIEIRIAEFSSNIEIPPMLFLPFLENAFKHGKASEEILKIEMKIEIVENQLNFMLKNSIPEQKEILDRNSGIGLENIQKRLKHIYGDAYRLEISEVEGFYIVQLKIPTDF